MVEADTAAGDRSRTLRGALTIVLSMLLVAAFVWLFVAARADDDSAKEQDSRDAVMLAARSYVKAASNYGPSDLDQQKLLTAYRERVRPLISTSYQPSFETSVENLNPLVVQGFGVSTTIDRVGVAELSADRALALVSGETARSLQNQTEQPQGYTLEVKFVKVDGAWLVDEAPKDVATAASGDRPTTTPDPSGDPEASETPGKKKDQQKKQKPGQKGTKK